MKRRIKTFLAGGVLALALYDVATAGPLEDSQATVDGLAAYQKGDYAAAMSYWRPLAEQGIAGVQFALGAMCYDGRGVAQDYAQAIIWFRKAADQGDASKCRRFRVPAFSACSFGT